MQLKENVHLFTEKSISSVCIQKKVFSTHLRYHRIDYNHLKLRNPGELLSTFVLEVAGATVIVRGCNEIPMDTGCIQEDLGDVKGTMCVCDSDLCNHGVAPINMSSNLFLILIVSNIFSLSWW